MLHSYKVLPFDSLIHEKIDENIKLTITCIKFHSQQLAFPDRGSKQNVTIEMF